MQYDFREAVKRLSEEVNDETNKILEEIKNNKELEPSEKFNRVMNEMTDNVLITTVKVFEDYHRSLMKYLSEKGL